MNSSQESISTWQRFQSPTAAVLTTNKVTAWPQTGLWGGDGWKGAKKSLQPERSFHKANMIMSNISAFLKILQWLHTVSRIKTKTLKTGATGWLSRFSVPTLYFGSGHDLRTVRSNPMLDSALDVRSA